MEQRSYRQKTGILWGMILIACLYIGLLDLLKTLTGNPVLDGAIGVLLGLYICSHPAAHLVDMIFFKRIAVPPPASRRSILGWLVLNFIVLLAAWLVIVSGTIRFINRSH